MFENPWRGRQARNFTTNIPKILDRKSSSEQILSENCRWVPLYRVPHDSSPRQKFYMKSRVQFKFPTPKAWGSNSPPPPTLEDSDNQIPSSQGRQRCQMPGVCRGGGGACWSFDLTGTLAPKLKVCCDWSTFLSARFSGGIAWRAKRTSAGGG